MGSQAVVREFDMMTKTRRARLWISGELLHERLGFAENIEVCDARLCLQGDGLPESCIVPEGGTPRTIDQCELPGADGSST